MTASQLIRKAREDASLTQAELAARAGMSQPVIARLERGDANPRVMTLDRVLRAAGARLELRADSATPPAVDETQIVERLRLSPAERLAAFETSQRNLSSLKQRARRVPRA
jgi:predicted transcriptional regulator